MINNILIIGILSFIGIIIFLIIFYLIKYGNCIKRIKLINLSNKINNIYKDYFIKNKTIKEDELKKLLEYLLTNFNNEDEYYIINNLKRCNFNLFNSLFSNFMKGNNINKEYLSKLNWLFNNSIYRFELNCNKSHLDINKNNFKPHFINHFDYKNGYYLNDIKWLMEIVCGLKDDYIYPKNDELKLFKQYIYNVINKQYGFIPKEFSYIYKIIDLLE